MGGGLPEGERKSSHRYLKLTCPPLERGTQHLGREASSADLGLIAGRVWGPFGNSRNSCSLIKDKSVCVCV